MMPPHLREWCPVGKPARSFSYVRGRLFDFARPRCFEVSVLPPDALARFGAGRFELERSGQDAYRCMGRRAEVTLAPVAGPARRTLRYRLPSKDATITISLNGRVAPREVREGLNTTSVDVTQEGNRHVQAVIEINRPFQPAGDPHELGLQLRSWSWSPVPESR